jgi:hypothetical protein
MLKMKNRFIWLGILLILVGVFAIGCYTVLMHPQVQGEGEQQVENTGQYYREHCTDCHTDYHNYPYGYYYGYYPDYYWSSPRWGHYYAYPWWWDRYSWGNDNNDNGVESVPKSDEKVERRRGMEPPYVPQSGTPAPFISIPPQTNEGQPLQIGNEGNSTTTTEQKKEEKPKDEKAPKRRKE